MANNLGDTKLKFYPKSHTYKYGKQKLTSVSEWLSSFNPPFKPFDMKVAKFVARKQTRDSGEKVGAKDVKAQWKAVTQEGTDVHAEIEQYINLDRGVMNLYNPTLMRAKYGIMEYNKFKTRYNPEGVFQETRIFSLEMGVAGTIDLLMLTDGKAVIIDWKTNRTLRGKIPTEDIESVMDLDGQNLSKYTMQLNTYAYILNKYYDYEIAGIKLVHLHEFGAEVMDVPFMPRLVEQLIEEDKHGKEE